MVSGRASGIGPASFFSFTRDVDEMVLAHVIENNVEAAYRRGDLVKMRAMMMESWAAFLGGTMKANRSCRLALCKDYFEQIAGNEPVLNGHFMPHSWRLISGKHETSSSEKHWPGL